MSSTLEKVRDHLKSEGEYFFLDSSNNKTTDILEATLLKFPNNSTNGLEETYQLNDETEFMVNSKKVPLRVILHCWINKDSNSAEYLEDCKAKNLINVSFLFRNDLINWLSGKSETSAYIQKINDSNTNINENATVLSEDVNDNINSPSTLTATTSIDMKTTPTNAPLDTKLKRTLEHERILLDHNKELRGSKPIDFGYLIKDAELKLVHSIKSSLKNKKYPGRDSSGISKHKQNAHNKNIRMKDPIILIPSAASSLFTLSNIKQFLIDEKYINPRDIASNHSELVTVEKKFDSLAKPARFLIVNNTRMFTKPEYWERVVAVFTTGHIWQFNNYQWNTPQELFQHCKGYYFYFNSDTVPQHVQQWNVSRVELDKNKRYKDMEVVRNFWLELEKELTSRGYH
ncbi:hypothetical protein TBLA_0I03150 [Henningerozyma blattae CBS 6284]|uniref:Cell division control protein 73 C-terminal domain-containing protein n=1 Tax=Henningerozyma blattae (strain ATCC 34711 / CBS 6284 / DSM 70876 / NBRC 10599 / NRRL Y-10934 / UCD 77-7) TaxID=1071380 RepID=I2H9B8_HENB6|nr:hypothetical protein TBLA_0I03150 [Tetrapisispora blattae CBS 6284]CCH62970.1 hypothetical protein TBLA_0I03150 [Tetrapisispora blattae CBS 6284]